MLKLFLTLTIFIQFGFYSFSQSNIDRKVIQKYIWRGNCEDIIGGSTGAKKIIIYIYDDSTYGLKSKTCYYGQNKKEWRERNKWMSYGKWTTKNSNRIFFYENQELETLYQEKDYLIYNERKLKSRHRVNK